MKRSISSNVYISVYNLQKKKMRKKVNSLESEWEFPLDATMISLKIIMWHNRKMRIFQHYWNDWNTTKWLQVLNDKNSTIAVI